MRADFYRSKEWEKLTKVLKMERLNENGELICAYCGRPIIKKYDAICHHVEHLTDENYTKAEVALNPDNIQIVHHGCHNLIHDKLKVGMREVFLVWGAPLSGKSTYVKSVMQPGDLLLDMDSIYMAISGQPLYTKPNALKAVAFDIRDLILRCARYRRGQWRNAYIVGGYPLTGERERLLQELGAREIYIDSTPEECTGRLLDDAGGRDIDEWLEYIEAWFRLATPPVLD